MTERPLILVIEDDDLMAALTCDLVGMAGVEAVHRRSVIEALDYLARHGALAIGVITDIHLGAPMSGIDLAIQVAAQWPAMAICVTSGIATERPRRLPDGAAFVPKPFQPGDVTRFARAAMDLAVSRGPTGLPP